MLDRPWLLSPGQLQSLHEQAEAANCVATVAAFRRWSADFVAASLAKQTGRLGNLVSGAILYPANKSLPLERQFLGRHPGILGFHCLDQLLVLVDSTPRRVFAGRLHDTGQTSEHGFLATIEFTSGCTAQIEIQTRTRLSHRTGWMLEGLAGSYRGERLFTTTPDGEIVDEALTSPEVPDNALIEELVSAWRDRRSNLPTLGDAVRVVQLIEALERSADSGLAVDVFLESFFMTDPLFSVEKRVVLVSGGSRGIGRSLAEGLAGRGLPRFHLGKQMSIRFSRPFVKSRHHRIPSNSLLSATLGTAPPEQISGMVDAVIQKAGRIDSLLERCRNQCDP